MHQSFSRKHANKRAHAVMNATGTGTAPGGTGTGVRLVRCVIDSVSLRTKATFSDNSSLVLDTRGRAFAAYVPKYAQHKSTSNAKAGHGHGHGIAPKTVCTRQLCRFCVSEHRPRVALALAFRNMHVDVPYVCDAVIAKNNNAKHPTTATTSPPPPPPAGSAATTVFHAAHRVCSLRWHASPARALEQNLVVRNGTTTVASACGRGQINVSASGHRFSVVYPLLISVEDNERATGRYAYVWQRQTFSTTEGGYPPRWDAAVRMAKLCARAAAAASTTETAVPPDIEQEAANVAAGTVHVYTDLPVDASIEDRTLDTQADAESLAGVREIRAIGTTSVAVDGDEAWWCDDHSLTLLPPKAAVQLEWRPACLLQYLPTEKEVEVVLGSDGTVMKSRHRGRLFDHHRAGGTDVYVEGQEPPPTGTFDMAAVLRAAESLLSHNLRVEEDDAATAAKRSTPVLYPSSISAPGGIAATAVPSGEVVEEQVDEAGSRYRLFADGHVRTLYADRTLVELDAGLEKATVTHSDGRRYECRCSHPVGAEAYVRCALEFAAWARRSPTERAQQAGREMEVLRENSKVRRMVRLAEYSANPGTACRDLPLPTCGDRLHPLSSEESPRAKPPRPHGSGDGETVVQDEGSENKNPSEGVNGTNVKAATAAPPAPLTPPKDWDLSTCTPSDRDAIIGEQLRRMQLWLEGNKS
ncbi:DUF4520 domain-containing protein [Pycnococcus provasolii]